MGERKTKTTDEPLGIKQKLVMEKLEKKAKEISQRVGYKVQPYEVRKYEVDKIVRDNEPYKSMKQKAIAEIKAQVLVNEEYPIYSVNDEKQVQALGISHHLYDDIENNEINKRAYLQQVIREIKNGL